MGRKTYISYMNDGTTVRIHGDLGPHCAECLDVAANLCDYPIGGDKTCDRMICHQHSSLVGDNMHYCSAHFAIYKKDNPEMFSNVISPFKRDQENEK